MYYPFELVDIPYSISSLEPFLSSRTVSIHYYKHLGNYINKLNETLKDYPMLHQFSLEELLNNLHIIPNEIKRSVINNGFGVYLHTLYFNNLKSNCIINDNILRIITMQFGSYENFVHEFKKVYNYGFGSFWVCLVKVGNEVIIELVNNNDVINTNILLIIDGFEHSYYLDYQNEKNKYLDNFFNNINWEVVLNNYLKIY